MENDIIFEPLAFRHWTVKNRIFRSNITGRFDNYDGSGTQARINWEEKFARGGVGGDDYHLGVKINAVDFNNALFPWLKKGNTLEESIQICKWATERQPRWHRADHLHISIGSIFPHPLLPPGGFPPDELNWWYGIMGSSGVTSYLNYAFFHFKLLRPIFLYLWNRTKKDHPIEGVCVEYAREAKKQVDVPVLCTGGFQDARLIRKVISEGWCDAVSIGRPLVANNNLPQIIASGKDLADRPCSFCNRCLVNAVFNPLGCYDVRRFDGDQEAMIAEVMSVFNPPRYLPTHYSETQSKGTANLPP